MLSPRFANRVFNRARAPARAPARFRSLVLITLQLPSCTLLHPTPPKPVVQVRVDTVIVTKEVVPPLPQGTATAVCLSTGQTIQIAIAPNGDTLIGEKRLRLLDIPGVAIAGTYAGALSWYSNNEPIQ